jgi:hypothetical protein
VRHPDAGAATAAAAAAAAVARRALAPLRDERERERHLVRG